MKNEVEKTLHEGEGALYVVFREHPEPLIDLNCNKYSYFAPEVNPPGRTQIHRLFCELSIIAWGLGRFLCSPASIRCKS
jgi:hypothetical protein